jgi:hypothetical protein
MAGRGQGHCHDESTADASIEPVPGIHSRPAVIAGYIATAGEGRRRREGEKDEHKSGNYKMRHSVKNMEERGGGW